jgi:hypothetical protein
MKGIGRLSITVVLAAALAPLNATMIVVAVPLVMADLHARPVRPRSWSPAISP